MFFITIRSEACDGCGKCAESCPSQIIGLVNGVAQITGDPSECLGCESCVIICEKKLIKLEDSDKPSGAGTPPAAAGAPAKAAPAPAKAAPVPAAKAPKAVIPEGTPMLDELEKGQWPSFVTEIKKAAKKSKAAADLLKQLETSYRDNVGHWKRGGIVGVTGYGGGVVGRYTAMPEEFPNVREFHTMRIAQPAGFFYTTARLRRLCDIWDKYGSGLLNLHGSTGDIILLGTTTANLQPCFDELTEAGYDLGGSGSAMRSLSCCVGQARCEKSCIDTTDLMDHLTRHFQNEIHRPAFPYKFKIKISGCPNDCDAAIARCDMPVIGVWRDSIVIDDAEVKRYAGKGLDIEGLVVRKCPTQALTWDANAKRLTVKADDCVHCMNCINTMPKAVRQGRERGATILVGGKAPVVKGALLGWVLVPFMPMEPPYTEFKNLVVKVMDWWADNGKNRERVGELIDRMGMPAFLSAIGLKPTPEMVSAPRSNPYLFWRKDEVIHG